MAICGPYPNLRPSDEHHLSIIRQSVCHHLLSVVAIYGPYPYLCPHKGHNLSVIASLSVIICYQTWLSVTCTHTCVPRMTSLVSPCVICQSVCHVCHGHLRSVSVPTSPRRTPLVCHLSICLSSSIVSCGHLQYLFVPTFLRWTSFFCPCSICLSVFQGHLQSVSVTVSPPWTSLVCHLSASV